MNRVGLGLAVGAGYVLGRTKKMKLAFAVGSLVAGKRMNLNPKAVAELVSGQLKDNPQFKEIGDQLREDLRGVGKAASGAMVERQVNALADRLHGRTAQVRDQLSGVVPGSDSEDAEDRDAEDYDEDAEDYDEEEPQEGQEDPEADETDETDETDEADDESESEREPAAKKAVKKAPAKKAPAKQAPTQKTAAKKTAAKKSAGKKTAAARDAGRGAGNRLPKGGGE
jgi:hypothetical protein